MVNDFLFSGGGRGAGKKRNAVVARTKRELDGPFVKERNRSMTTRVLSLPRVSLFFRVKFVYMCVYIIYM